MNGKFFTNNKSVSIMKLRWSMYKHQIFPCYRYIINCVILEIYAAQISILRKNYSKVWNH